MKIGLLGFGVVGRGVYDITAEMDDIQVAKIICLEDISLPDAEVTRDINSILTDDSIDTVIEAMGGLHPAYEFVRASIEAGDVNMLMMKTVFPFGNEVATLTVTGAELLEAIEAATFCTPESVGAFPQVAGIEFTIDTTVPYENGAQYANSTYFAPANPGARVTIATVNGQPWAADAVYTIATNDFTAAGGDTYYAFKYPYTQTGYNTEVALEDALISYTQTVLNGVIGAEYAAPAGRIIIK